jgi:hypothetical protein
MKILFVGVFDNIGKSTNNSQIINLKKHGHEIVGYNYRIKATRIGQGERDKDLSAVIASRNFDLVLFSKCNQVSYNVFMGAKKHSKTCLWFMDPLISYDKEMREKTGLVDFFCCDKKNVFAAALKINKNSFHVCEGFDELVEFPKNTSKDYDISFIGNIYGEREEWLRNIKKPVTVFSNVFTTDHSEKVSRTKINLNFCTDGGASDRVYKVLAAGGFLISNDWDGRSDMFEENKDLVIFTDIKDLNDKINYYLNNSGKREEIAKQGNKTVQKYNRFSWAQQIINIHERLYR